MKTSFWHTYASQVVPHFNNAEILPIKLNQKHLIKLLKEAW